MAVAAVLAIKAKTGLFPSTLPAGLTDPYTGNPLGYRREGGKDFVVYSVGVKGTFDGGKPGDKPNADNVYFRYPAPPRVPTPVAFWDTD